MVQSSPFGQSAASSQVRARVVVPSSPPHTHFERPSASFGGLVTHLPTTVLWYGLLTQHVMHISLVDSLPGDNRGVVPGARPLEPFACLD